MQYTTVCLILINLVVLKCLAFNKHGIDDICIKSILNDSDFTRLAKFIIPDMDGKRKGDAGKILIVGGSAKYTGAPFFAAISALKVGADLVHILTTEEAAPVIKTYSPDLIVIPYKLIDIRSLIKTSHVIVLGPGLGREPENLKLAYDVIDISKSFAKPLVIDADGIYAVDKNISVLNNYPEPGVILTPNYREANRLAEAMPVKNEFWFERGINISVLVKGENDDFYSNGNFYWTIKEGGSGRRAGGQGDILAGSIGTFLHWALDAEICNNDFANTYKRGIASYAAAKLTRLLNNEAFQKHGRSMIASDMIKEIHMSFDKLFCDLKL